MNRQNVIEVEHICASTVPIFKTLSYGELQKVNSLIQKKEYKKGNVLFMRGDQANHLYIVRYGRVKLYEASKDGRQQIVRILERGDFFGELSLFKDECHLLNAEALEDTGLCLLPREDLKNLIRQNPEMSLSIMQAMSKRLAYSEKFIGDLTLKNVEERLASWLMVMAEKEGVSTLQGIRISINLSRQEVANLLGTTIETVSRKLTKLQSEGIIAIEGQKNITILDKKRLVLITD
ncbi:Crp/Fnr family transcriptional regulator [Desulfolucanica intricata]|uniref:Crp/Fnr family transcriptional regulator n=1 Tax=Desulfolucanica intricata TaxID=1285191 RepID=UPI00082B9F9E|nr:Crp/Fnr family transcriptional regulator [Desulfolucanica intricata]